MVKRTISAKRILKDVRAGFHDDYLCEKYRITPRTLQYIFRKLVQAGLMTDLEFYERSRLTESDVFRAFSEEADGILRCPGCGQTLPEHGGECIFCLTVDSTMKTSPPSEVFDDPGHRGSNLLQSGIEAGTKTQ